MKIYLPERQKKVHKTVVIILDIAYLVPSSGRTLLFKVPHPLEPVGEVKECNKSEENKLSSSQVRESTTITILQRMLAICYIFRQVYLELSQFSSRVCLEEVCVLPQFPITGTKKGETLLLLPYFIL